VKLIRFVYLHTQSSYLDFLFFDEEPVWVLDGVMLGFAGNEEGDLFQMITFYFVPLAR